MVAEGTQIPASLKRSNPHKVPSATLKRFPSRSSQPCGHMIDSRGLNVVCAMTRHPTQREGQSGSGSGSSLTPSVPVSFLPPGWHLHWARPMSAYPRGCFFNPPHR